jgi:uncharacterized protein (DUF2141 family)
MVGAFLASGSVDAQQPRDTADAVRGTAAIEGVVVSQGMPATPLRRAVVTVSGGSLPRSRSTITDDRGEFVFDSLPEGRYTVTAVKPAYLETAYGAKRPGRTGVAISIAAGERQRITIPLARGAVITGTVRDERGTPVPGAAVFALHVGLADPASGADVTASTVTDDRGIYRLYGLSPGDYLVAARQRQIGTGEIGRRTAGEMDALLSALAQRRSSVGAPGLAPASLPSSTESLSLTLAPTYYPGTAVATDATRVRVGAAEEREGIDIVTRAVAAARIEGVIRDTAGQVPAGVQMSITAAGPRITLPTIPGSTPVLSKAPGPDGVFAYTNVPPGRYAIMARARRQAGGTPAPEPARGVTTVVSGGGGGGTGPGATSGPAPSEFLFARADFDINGQQVDGVSLVLRPGTTFAGRIAFDAAALAPPRDVTTTRVQLSPPGGTSYTMVSGTLMGNTFRASASTMVRPDGTFAIDGVAPGDYTLRITLPDEAANDWWLRSAILGARDLLDGRIEMTIESDVRDVVVTLSDAHTELTGTLQQTADTNASDHFIVVVPADRALWQPGSRRFQFTRPATDGAFVIRDLPPGDYLMAALTDFDASDFNDLVFVEQLAGAAIPVTVQERGRTVQDVRLGRR